MYNVKFKKYNLKNFSWRVYLMNKYIEFKRTSVKDCTCKNTHRIIDCITCTKTVLLRLCHWLYTDRIIDCITCTKTVSLRLCHWLVHRPYHRLYYMYKDCIIKTVSLTVHRPYHNSTFDWVKSINIDYMLRYIRRAVKN